MELPEEKKMSGLAPGEPVIAPAWMPLGRLCPFRGPPSLPGFSNDELVVCPKPAAILTPPLLPSAIGHSGARLACSPLTVPGSPCGCASLSAAAVSAHPRMAAAVLLSQPPACSLPPAHCPDHLPRVPPWA